MTLLKLLALSLQVPLPLALSITVNSQVTNTYPYDTYPRMDGTLRSHFKPLAPCPLKEFKSQVTAISYYVLVSPE